MQDKIYICKIAPNKMVLSRALLELLGEDLEAYAIELTKYKTPLREYFLVYSGFYQISTTHLS